MDRIIQTGILLVATAQVFVEGCGVKIVQDGIAVLPLYHWTSRYCLNVVPDQTDWYQARATCLEKRGELMVIENQEQQAELAGGLRAAKDMDGWSFWIGLFQVDATVHTSYQWSDSELSCTYTESSARRNCVKGKYDVTRLLCDYQKCCYDKDKTPPCTFPVVPDTFVGYSAWSAGSPTVSNDRMCTLVQDSSSYKWVDRPCLDKSGQVGFICRFKEEPPAGAVRPTYPPQDPSTAEPKSADDSEDSNVTWIAIGIVCLLLLLILLAILICCCIRKKQREDAQL